MTGVPEQEQLAAIRFLLTDVDGVLTDGRIHLDWEGRESKVFHVHDGAGLAYWHRAGGKSGFLSGRAGKVVEERARALKVDEIHMGHLDKLPVFLGILERQGLAAQEVAYIGDDLVDLPVLEKVGFAVSVPNACVEVRERVHYVTKTAGGSGALREVIEILLKARGRWEEMVRQGGRP